MKVDIQDDGVTQVGDLPATVFVPQETTGNKTKARILFLNKQIDGLTKQRDDLMAIDAAIEAQTATLQVLRTPPVVQ